LWNLIKDYDIIFYVSPEGVEMEDNGVRETDLGYRNAVDKQIKSILNSHRTMPGKVVEIEGSTEERIEQIKDTLASL